MKRLIAAVAIAILSAGAVADDVYRGLAKGSPDLQEPHLAQTVGARHGGSEMAAFETGTSGRGPAPFVSGRGVGDGAQPSGFARDVYSAFCGGNQDLGC